MMSHAAIVLVEKTMNARNRHIHVIVAVGSRFQPAKIRVGRPTRIEMRSTRDETKKRRAHGFDRSVDCPRTIQLRVLPIIPKMKMVGDRYRFNCS